MERYVLSMEGGGPIDWDALLAAWSAIRLITAFPSGKAYIETDTETFEALRSAVPGLTGERIARQGP